MKTTKTGFDFTIQAFLEHDPEYMFATVDKNQATMIDPKTARANIEKALKENGFVDIKIKMPKYRARRTVEKIEEPKSD